MAVTSIEARCRHCGRDVHLSEVRDLRTGQCPRCGRLLAPDWTDKLLHDATRADAALQHLVAALRALRRTPGHLSLRPHSVLRNLVEEVGWDDDLAAEPELLADELPELRRLHARWEGLARTDRGAPAPAGAGPGPAPRQGRFRRLVATLFPGHREAGFPRASSPSAPPTGAAVGPRPQGPGDRDRQLEAA
ncbi:MAG TPA: hypothetical protein VIL48_05910 [Acidimicrobiales bacterium]